MSPAEQFYLSSMYVKAWQGGLSVVGVFAKYVVYPALTAYDAGPLRDAAWRPRRTIGAQLNDTIAQSRQTLGMSFSR